jgi:hypothetical protein
MTRPAGFDYGLLARATAPDQLTPAQRAIFEFCAAVRRGEPVPPALLLDLAEKFERIMGGEDAAHALGLAKRRGAQTRRNPQEYWRRVHIAATVLQAKRHNRRMTIAALADALVPEFSEKASFIVDCYERHRAIAPHYLAAAQSPVSAARIGKIRDLAALPSAKLAKLSGLATVIVNPIKAPRLNR